ncbi:MAG: Ig-like domain-containing protein [Ruminococcus sp.]|nr:Ig-like domain-containing protein [Ruminococcus sp.]
MKRKSFMAALVAFALAATSFTTGTGLVFAADESGTAYSLGDTNGDGSVDAKDASEILAEYSRLSTNQAALFTDARVFAADVNKNGKIDASDASDVLGYYSYISVGGTLSFTEFLSDPNAETGTTTTATAATTAPADTTTTATVTTAATTDTPTTTSAPVTTAPDPNRVTEILLSRSNVTLNVGAEELAARLTILPDSATDLSTTWSSSDESVVTVDADGLLKGIAAGTATITVKSVNNPEVTAEISVTVAAETTTATAPADLKKVTSIHLTRTEMTIEKGTGELSAIVTMLPATATDLREIWTSSDESVAVVDGEGYVSAIAAGKCTITVQSANNPAVTASVEVTVTENGTTLAPATTTESATTTTATESATTTTTATSSAATTTAATTTTTTATSAATTSAATTTASETTTSAEPSTTTTASTTAAESTTTQTTASTAETDTTSTSATTSTVPADPSKVAEIKLSESSFRLAVGEKVISYVTMLPETAVNKKEIWSSSDVSVASVDKFGNITAEGIGECAVTVRSADNPDVTAEIKVKVVSDTAVRAIKLSDYVLELEIGELGISWVTMLPEKATNKNEIWTCSDVNVATVDQNGWILGRNVGECVVTVYSADDPEVKADIMVSVVPKAVVRSYIVENETTSEHTAFCTLFPKKAKGSFTIEYVIMNTNGSVNTVKTSPLAVPTLTSYTAYIKGETDTFEVSSYLINNDTGARARIGVYRFFDGGRACESQIEDINYAFFLVDGLKS